MFEKIITIDKIEHLLNIFGSYDENINALQKEYNVSIVNRGDDIKITGTEENVAAAAKAIETLVLLSEKGERINDQNLRYVFSLVKEGLQNEVEKLSDDGICVTLKGKIVKPKTLGQKKYVDAIRKNTVVLGVGPAGTGKTYLAVAMAVKAFRAHDVSKIILTRPAVEAGEKL